MKYEFVLIQYWKKYFTGTKLDKFIFFNDKIKKKTFHMKKLKKIEMKRIKKKEEEKEIEIG